MKRLWSTLATAIVVLPVALFACFLWFNWGKPVALPTDDPRIISLDLPVYRHLVCTVPEALLGVFTFGAVMGVLATLVTFAARSRSWRVTIEELQASKRKLAAANRALDASVPVLREGFDRAIGAFDEPTGATRTPYVDPVPVGSAKAEDDDISSGVDLQQLAIEDARNRRESHRAAGR